MGGYDWRVKAVSSLIIVFSIQHSLPKCLKSHFQGPKFQKCSGDHALRPPYIICNLYCHDFKDLSAFGGRVSRRFSGKCMEGAGESIFCNRHILGDTFLRTLNLEGGTYFGGYFFKNFKFGGGNIFVELFYKLNTNPLLVIIKEQYKQLLRLFLVEL